jgi:hypothetical protein
MGLLQLQYKQDLVKALHYLEQVVKKDRIVNQTIQDLYRP